MDPGDIAPTIMFSLFALITGAVLIFRGPLGRALARRIEGDLGVPQDLEARLNDLEARLAAGDQERAELAERLDFAERLVLEAKDHPKGLGR